jgi:hypothetical protein
VVVFFLKWQSMQIGVKVLIIVRQKKVATWKKRARANVSPHPSPKPLSLGKALGKHSSHNEGDDLRGDKPKLKKQNVARVLSDNVISLVEAVEQPYRSQ